MVCVWLCVCSLYVCVVCSIRCFCGVCVWCVVSVCGLCGVMWEGELWYSVLCLCVVHVYAYYVYRVTASIFLHGKSQDLWIFL